MVKILIIDDDSTIRATMRDVLEDQGHEIIEAENGTKGVEMFRRTPFDLVISDLIMPGMDGVELIKELKRDYPEVIIIAISGGGRTRNLDFLRLAQMHGAVSTLAKPYQSDALLSVVDKALASIVRPAS